MKLNRRNFIKAAAMSAATAAAAKGAVASPVEPALSPKPHPVLDPVDGEITYHKAPCRFCGTGCHVKVGVKNDRIVSVTGDELAEVNKGLLCVKGYHVGEILYGRDRLTTPLLKKGGKQVPISWDEAIDVIAKRIMKNPASFGYYGSGQWTVAEGYIANKFTKGGLSNNNVDPNARLCMASAVTGFLATYGVDEPASCYDDLDECDVVITWGNNPAEMHPVLMSRIVDRNVRKKHVKIIDIGTRRTRTTDFADHFLNFRPQTDLAILMGLMYVLVQNDQVDRDFVEKHCNFRKNTEVPSLFGEAQTYEEFVTALEPYTPEYVEELSGVSADDIRMLAGMFGDPKLKIVSLWCMGANQHTRGTAVNSLIHAVHLLSGHWGKPGDGPQSLTGQPSACGTAREVGCLAHLLPGGRLIKVDAHRADAEERWNLPAGRISPTPGTHTVKMFGEFCTEGGSVDTIWVQVSNPAQSLPNSDKLFFAKDDCTDKFLIVSDVYPTATTREADLVLPAALWVEKNGIFGNSERRTQQWFRMVMPPEGARDDVWQTLAVARRLYDLGFEGMKDKDGKFLFPIYDEAGNEVEAWKWEHFYDVNVDKQLYEEYRGFTFMKHKNVAPYDALVATRGMRWPVVEQPDGSFRETRWRFAEFDDPYVAEGAGIDFYHSKTNDGKAQVWSHPYEAPPEMPDGTYPYWLCTGRVVEQWHTGTMTDRVPQLHAAMPGGYVELNPTDAREKGIADGDPVRLKTRRGELVLPASVGGRGEPPRGSVFVPFFDEDLLINKLTLDAVDPFSKQPDYKKCAVDVSKVVEE